ncbi:MAG TPA: ABC transporter substrate-binding protein [Stellaceae bacterium]|jgi:branched-chain amino acid transport system substrate-binding protein|nr:ABC transporter substrate-binding protein [Stellaceae bacterium]
MKRSAILALGVASLLWAAAGSAGADEVVIAAQYPLSGPMASYSGPFLREGTEIAIQRINETQMLGKGRTLKVIIEDNAGDRNQAISLMNRFATSDNALAVLGVYGSYLSLPAAPVANELKIPFLAIAASPAIVQAGPWSFILIEQPNDSMKLLAQYAAERLHVKTAALVFDRANDASVRLKDSFAKYLKERGGSVVSEDGISAQDTNFAPIATKIASEKIDALFLESVPSVAGNFLVQVRQAGLSPDVKLLASGQVSSPVFRSIAGAAAEGILYPADYVADMSGEENKYFADEYRKRSHKDPDQNAAWAYTGMLLLAHAIHDAGPGADRAKVRDAMAKLTNVEVPLGAGKFSYDKDRMPNFDLIMLQVVKGVPQIVK